MLAVGFKSGPDENRPLNIYEAATLPTQPGVYVDM
jgi:hypothetical protein